MLLVTVISTVILMVTLEGQWNAGSWGHTAELDCRVTGSGGCRERKIYETQIIHILAFYTRQGWWCHSRHPCSSLMSPQSLSLSHFQMLLMHFPLAQRCWFGRQVCSERVNKSQEIHLNFIKMFNWHLELLISDTSESVRPVLTHVLLRSWYPLGHWHWCSPEGRMVVETPSGQTQWCLFPGWGRHRRLHGWSTQAFWPKGEKKNL